MSQAGDVPGTAPRSFFAKGGSGRPLLIILATSIVTHGLMILNDGNYWDGWLIGSFAQDRDWKALCVIFDSIGLPLYKYFHWVMGAFPAPFLAYRLTSFLALTSTAMFVCLICRETGWLSREESVWLALLSLTFPALRVAVDVVVIPYVVFCALFFTGAWLALQAERRTGAGHWKFRIPALVCFYLSFHLNSLLMFFGGFCLLLLCHRRSRREEPLKETVRWMLTRRADYWALPLLFWFIKKAFIPSGAYNQFQLLPPKHFFRHIGRFVEYSIYDQINEAIQRLVSQPLLLLVIGLAGWFVLRRRQEKPETGGGESGFSPLRAIQFGIVLLVLGMAPYLAVGYSPRAEGFNSRHAILMSLPVSILLLALSKIVFGQGEEIALTLRRLFLTLLVSAFAITMVATYQGWQARWAKDRSIMLQIAAHPEYQKYSWFWVRDTFPVGGETSYKFWEWSSMFARVSGREAYIGIDVVDCDPEFLAIVPRSFDREHKLGEFDPKGAHADLTVRRGSEPWDSVRQRTEPWDNARIAGKYLFFRYINPRRMDVFLKNLTEITIEPAAQHPPAWRK